MKIAILWRRRLRRYQQLRGRVFFVKYYRGQAWMRTGDIGGASSLTQGSLRTLSWALELTGGQ